MSALSIKSLDHENKKNIYNFILSDAKILAFISISNGIGLTARFLNKNVELGLKICLRRRNSKSLNLV